MTEQLGHTQQVADFVINTNLKDIPPDAVHGAKLLILDTIGVGIAALGQPVARAMLDYVQWTGGRPIATVLGTKGFKTAPNQAALANACLFNMLDYDGFHHVPTHVLAASLAAGELVEATGEQMLGAFILASEFAHQFNEVFDGPHTERDGPAKRGWYHLSIYGPIACALASSRLLGLDVAQTRAAMGNAVCGSGGVRQVLGTQAKGLAPGHSASFGVQAALLAQRGMLGDPDILEARLGLVKALCLPGEADWEHLSKLGTSYALARSQSLKRYPSVSPTHGVIAALQGLMREHQFGAGEVESLVAEISVFSAREAYATDTLSAGFSWPYILGATLLDGGFKAEHLLEERVGDPRIREVASHIKFVPRPSNSDPQSLTVTLRDGRTVQADVKGSQARMETEDEVLAKYRDCASAHLSPDDIKLLYRRVMDLEKLGSIAELTRIL